MDHEIAEKRNRMTKTALATIPEFKIISANESADSGKAFGDIEIPLLERLKLGRKNLKNLMVFQRLALRIKNNWLKLHSKNIV